MLLQSNGPDKIRIPLCSQNMGGPLSGSQTQRPPSQATSVKAEPGSNMGSIASASIVNRVSIFSLKFFSLYSIEHLGTQNHR